MEFTQVYSAEQILVLRESIFYMILYALTSLTYIDKILSLKEV